MKDYLVAYPSGNQKSGHGELKDWQGNVIGSWTEISHRRAVWFGRLSWVGSTYYYMRATLADGRRYALRGYGVGVLAKDKRIKEKQKAKEDFNAACESDAAAIAQGWDLGQNDI